MPQKIKNRVGRPSKFNSINLEQLKTMYLFGLTDFEIASLLGVSHRTLDYWYSTHPKFYLSVKEWKTAADARVERRLHERAMGYSHEEEVLFHYQGSIIKTKTIKHYPPDKMACMYWLNNRRRGEWMQQPKGEESGNLINETLEFKDIPSNGEGLSRFEQFIKN